jgi:hypothetical protein
MLLLAQGAVNGPATADMGTRAPQVAEDFQVGAARLFQCVGQDEEAGWVELPAGQDALLVGGLCQGRNRGAQDSRVEGDRSAPAKKG